MIVVGGDFNDGFGLVNDARCQSTSIGSYGTHEKRVQNDVQDGACRNVHPCGSHPERKGGSGPRGIDEAAEPGHNAAIAAHLGFRLQLHVGLVAADLTSDQ